MIPPLCVWRREEDDEDTRQSYQPERDERAGDNDCLSQRKSDNAILYPLLSNGFVGSGLESLRRRHEGMM
jgi:hypothetical protein